MKWLAQLAVAWRLGQGRELQYYGAVEEAYRRSTLRLFLTAKVGERGEARGEVMPANNRLSRSF